MIVVECQVNKDCPLDKTCLSEECVNPCIGISCGRNAECYAAFHMAKCRCSRGLQGNPYVNCVPVECRVDTDCSDNENCDRTSQKCTPLCRDRPCADGAICTAANHRETCQCSSPLQGDGFTFCAKCKFHSLYL
jgi:hypothetical protein